ncbi:hypothetical protein [Xanthomonas phage Carpasina]|uniref:Tail fiber protein n=3 Tax=Carpasinavirus TaxID=2733099 RepID=A0A2S1GSP4_9CAUD|nr:tail fiber protein [Xanthomonas phage Carpasina]AWD92417.1 hypothetical protein [Xanthomonas phage Carpasina]QJB22082.1 putative structural protein [Xanthomonas phage FoX6]QJB22181.1 putative structural protein [Xanthomonas phage FoX7]
MAGLQLIRGIKIKKVSSRFTSSVPRHMREDGTSIVDTRIIKSAQLTVEAICPSIDEVEQVISLASDRESLLRVTSKGVVFENMMIQATSNMQSKEMLSGAPFQITFKQLLLQNVMPVSVSQAADSTTMDRGIQILNTARSNVQGLASSFKSRISGFF